jgi:uncharacterized protein
MYFPRHAEKTIRNLASMFPAVLITGARQVGKTTLLEHEHPDLPFVSLDDPQQLLLAREDPKLFFKSNPPPLVLDEVQYAPELFPVIKWIADRNKLKGQFYLTGSQQFSMMEKVSESLVGRIGIITLTGLSLREIMQDPFSESFIPSISYLEQRKAIKPKLEYPQLWKIIHQGTMPVMHAEKMDWQLFYSAYVKTYIERDVRDQAQIGNEQYFLKFMTSLASRTAQMLNLTALANDAGISIPTAQRWLSVLVSSHIVYLLQPFYANITKRMLKTPKLYFLDTGLAAWLTRWSSAETLEKGAMSGPFFETFVVSEVLKSFYHQGVSTPPLYYYRDKDGIEIDLLIYQNGLLHPIEIKKASQVSKRQLANFTVLDTMKGMKTGPGGIICLYDNLLALDDRHHIIPVAYL